MNWGRYQLGSGYTLVCPYLTLKYRNSFLFVILCALFLTYSIKRTTGGILVNPGLQGTPKDSHYKAPSPLFISLFAHCPWCTCYAPLGCHWLICYVSETPDHLKDKRLMHYLHGTTWSWTCYRGDIIHRTTSPHLCHKLKSYLFIFFEVCMIMPIKYQIKCIWNSYWSWKVHWSISERERESIIYKSSFSIACLHLLHIFFCFLNLLAAHLNVFYDP